MSIARKLLSVNALVGLGLVLGFFSNVVLASVFGLTSKVDAYFAALTLPSLCMILFIDYLGKNFLPVYARAQEVSEEMADELASAMVTTVALLTLLIVALLAFFGEAVFAFILPGFASENVALANEYFLIMVPSVVLMAITTFHEYICQYRERYVQVAAIQMFLPGANLFAIITLRPWLNEYCLPVGFLLGHLLVFIAMARLAGYKYRPRVQIRSEWEGRVFRNSAVLMGSGLIARARGLLVNYFASTVGTGAISAMALANKIISPLRESALRGIRMIVFSRSAKLFAQNDEASLGRLYDISSVVIFLFLVPCLVWLAIYRLEVVSLVFMRGAFTLDMAQLVAIALLALLPSAVFVGVGQILTNAFYAIDSIRLPVLLMPIATVVYAIAAALLAPLRSLAGIALATSIAGFVVFATLVIGLAHRLRSFRATKVMFDLSRYTLVAGAAFGGPAWLFSYWQVPDPAAAFAGLLAGSTIYLALLILTRDAGWHYVQEQLRRLLPAGPWSVVR